MQMRKRKRTFAKQTKQTIKFMKEERPRGDGSLPVVYVANEHRGTETSPIFQVARLEKGQAVVKKETVPPTLFFILNGNLADIPVALRPARQEIAGGSLFFIPDGETFYGKASEASTLLICILRDYPVYLLHALEADAGNSGPAAGSEGICILPLLPALWREAETVVRTPDSVYAASWYALHKTNVLLLLMQHLYTSGELGQLFAPILHTDLNFRETVLKNYHNINRIKDLTEQLNIPPSTFNRKFREAFHMNAKEWLIQKRKESLLNDILLTDMSLNEIADKYELTPNYLMKVCKDTFHQTFTELRSQNRPDSGERQPF